MANANPPLLDRLDRLFTTLGRSAGALVVDGRKLHPGLPQRKIAMTELRSILLHPSTGFEARDAALGAVIRRAQSDGEPWTTAVLGLLLHGLRRTAGRLARGYSGNIEDLDAEIIAGALIAIGHCDTSIDGIASRVTRTPHPT